VSHMFINIDGFKSSTGVSRLEHYTKPFFIIFAAFTASVISDLESRSEVIQDHAFWRQSKARVRLYIGR